MLEAGRLAPAAANRQDWKSIVVRDHRLRKKLVTAAGGHVFLGEAPVVLVDCATEPQYVMSCGQPAGMVDVTIAFAFMMPEAMEPGQGAY